MITPAISTGNIRTELTIDPKGYKKEISIRKHPERFASPQNKMLQRADSLSNLSPFIQWEEILN
jgi:hypothetical protein